MCSPGCDASSVGTLETYYLSAGAQDGQSSWIPERMGRVSGFQAQLASEIVAAAVNGKELHRAVQTASGASVGRVGFLAVKAALLKVAAGADGADLPTKSFNVLRRSGDHAAARKNFCGRRRWRGRSPQWHARPPRGAGCGASGAGGARSVGGSPQTLAINWGPLGKDGRPISRELAGPSQTTPTGGGPHSRPHVARIRQRSIDFCSTRAGCAGYVLEQPPRRASWSWGGVDDPGHDREGLFVAVRMERRQHLC